MSGKIPDAQLSPFNELVARRLGLHFPPERRVDLERGVRAAAAGMRLSRRRGRLPPGTAERPPGLKARWKY